jgi:hypothetical protein
MRMTGVDLLAVIVDESSMEKVCRVDTAPAETDEVAGQRTPYRRDTSHLTVVSAKAEKGQVRRDILDASCILEWVVSCQQVQ